MPRKPKPVHAPSKTQKAIVPPTQAHTHTVSVERPGFFSNVWQGFGLGTGQAIAHSIFRSDPIFKVALVVNQNHLPKEFVQCMEMNKNNIELCKSLLPENKSS